jgi:hypothetical protein
VSDSAAPSSQNVATPAAPATGTSVTVTVSPTPLPMYRWRFGEWSYCDCGAQPAGVKSRSAECVSALNETVSPSTCEGGLVTPCSSGVCGDRVHQQKQCMEFDCLAYSWHVHATGHAASTTHSPWHVCVCNARHDTSHLPEGVHRVTLPRVQLIRPESPSKHHAHAAGMRKRGVRAASAAASVHRRVRWTARRTTASADARTTRRRAVRPVLPGALQYVRPAWLRGRGPHARPAHGRVRRSRRTSARWRSRLSCKIATRASRALCASTRTVDPAARACTHASAREHTDAHCIHCGVVTCAWYGTRAVQRTSRYPRVLIRALAP